MKSTEKVNRSQWPELEEAYRQMAADQKREAEALDWAESLIGDVANEPIR